MPDSTFRHRNHFVPEFLLRNFAASDGKLWEYRFIVENAAVPVWTDRSPKVTARFPNLYTVAASDTESDRVERWLDEEFETPAQPAIRAALNGEQLNGKQWSLLHRLYAVQYLRTPAYYIRHRERWAAEMEVIIRERQDELLARLPKAADWEGEVHVLEGPDRFPLRYTLRKHEGLRRSLRIEHVTGRKHWMWHVETGLRNNGPLDLLSNQQWSILTAPSHLQWFLSDNPATCLLRKPDGSQTLDGGWGTNGSVLMLPLSPKKLIYCKVGETFEDRYSTVHPLVAQHIRASLADVALRSVYCATQDDQVVRYRPRLVDPAKAKQEAEEWQRFGQEHTLAERFT
jgi:hypothetical protein